MTLKTLEKEQAGVVIAFVGTCCSAATIVLAWVGTLFGLHPLIGATVYFGLALGTTIGRLVRCGQARRLDEITR